MMVGFPTFHRKRFCKCVRVDHAFGMATLQEEIHKRPAASHAMYMGLTSLQEKRHERPAAVKACLEIGTANN